MVSGVSFSYMFFMLGSSEKFQIDWVGLHYLWSTHQSGWAVARQNCLHRCNSCIFSGQGIPFQDHLLICPTWSQSRCGLWQYGLRSVVKWTKNSPLSVISKQKPNSKDLSESKSITPATPKCNLLFKILLAIQLSLYTYFFTCALTGLGRSK